MFIFVSGTLLIYSLSNIKVTTVEEVNKKLKDTTLVVEDLIMQSPDVMCMCNVNGKIIIANTMFWDNFDNLDSNSNIFNLSINDGTWLEKLKSGLTITYDYVNKIKKTGQIRYLSLKIYPTFTSDKIISNFIFFGEDITIRKNAEEALKNAYEELESRVIERTAELSKLNDVLQNEIQEHEIDEQKIKASLKEKEVLLKEIHHRVKNNMQIISSMLGLQSAYVQDQNFTSMLKDSQGRIRSMALIHEKLYQSDNLAYVNFTEYLNSLILYLKNSYNIYDDRITFNMCVDNISLNIDIAIPLGLIINELISNSYKHAFKNNLKGEINVEIFENSDESFLLTVKDNGIGLPQEFDIDNTKSLGLQLVKVLVEQIDGDLKIKNQNGAIFEINFKVR
jgi:two-component sensor histidine kinase